MTQPPVRTEHLRTPGHSAPLSREAMLQRVARFASRVANPGAFPDLQQQGRLRSVSYQLSPGERCASTSNRPPIARASSRAS